MTRIAALVLVDDDGWVEEGLSLAMSMMREHAEVVRVSDQWYLNKCADALEKLRDVWTQIFTPMDGEEVSD